jgi:hypothetical protein
VNDSWLDLPQVETKYDPAHWRRPRIKYEPVKHNNSPEAKRRELLALKRELGIPMRTYLQCLIECGFHYTNAHKAFTLKGYLVDKSTLTRWRQRPRMERAIEIAESQALEMAGVSAAKVLMNVERLSQHSLEDIPLRDRNGEIIMEPDPEKPGDMRPATLMRSPEMALKANELLGKNKKLWGNDQQSTRVVVNLVDLSGRTDLDSAGQVYEGEAGPASG